LKGDEAGQFDDPVMVEKVPELGDQRVVDGARIARHPFGHLKGGPLAPVEMGASVPVRHRIGLFLADAALHQHRGIEVDAEGAAIELRHPHGDQRAQRRRHRRAAPVEGAIEQGEHAEHPGRARP